MLRTRLAGTAAVAALAAFAAAMTGVLRAQTGGTASDYSLVGAPKAVAAALLGAKCTASEPTCAALLGATLGVELTLGGELERRGGHQILTLALTDVHGKRRLRSVRQIGDAKADPNKLARAAYTRLTSAEVGALALLAKAQQGEILIDGQVVGALFEGHATLDGLVKGAHVLAIHARGYRPFETDVTIEAATKQMLLLDPE